MSVIQQSIQRSRNILHEFTPLSQGLSIIYQPSLSNGFDRVDSLRFYGFITSLRATIDINSIAESTLPDLDPIASRVERLTAVRDMEWKSQRKQLQILMKTSQTGWIPLADISLLNRLPYYVINLLPYLTDSLTFDIANNTTIGMRIVDAGYGVLTGTDRVTLFGSVREELTSLPTDMPEISSSQSYGFTIDTDSQIILPSNPNRLQVTLVNTSTSHTIYLNWGATAVVNQGIALLPNGGSYEINLSNPYRGMISAVSTGDAHLSAIECV